VSSDFEFTARSIKNDAEAPTLVVYSNCYHSDSLSVTSLSDRGNCEVAWGFSPFSFLRLLIFETRHHSFEDGVLAARPLHQSPRPGGRRSVHSNHLIPPTDSVVMTLKRRMMAWATTWRRRLMSTMTRLSGHLETTLVRLPHPSK